MNQVADQLPALIGVIVGAIGTILATSLADRTRWRRGQSVRWDERRLEAYAEYAQAIKDVHLLTFRITRGAEGYPPLARDTGLELLSQASLRSSQAWEAVLLLGDAATVVAARTWRQAVRELERLAMGYTDRPDGWPEAVKEADLSRDRFYAAARRSLVVSGGSVEQVPWLSYETNS